MIPSIEWFRLQFWPKTPSSYKSLQYTGRFKLKFMVQQRQGEKIISILIMLLQFIGTLESMQLMSGIIVVLFLIGTLESMQLMSGITVVLFH